jgi:hypothetical protein
MTSEFICIYRSDTGNWKVILEEVYQLTQHGGNSAVETARWKQLPALGVGKASNYVPENLKLISNSAASISA